MLITNRNNTRFGKYEGFSTHLLIDEFNSAFGKQREKELWPEETG